MSKTCKTCKTKYTPFGYDGQKCSNPKGKHNQHISPDGSCDAWSGDEVKTVEDTTVLEADKKNADKIIAELDKDIDKDIETIKEHYEEAAKKTDPKKPAPKKTTKKK